ncbi:MAG: isoprenylcysteine carboxylmethyltransferase family protein [Lachnospiraceae bacterium]|nr:isoprenylcysteine carboxylmethyltransferase family protein [Lachnospiraceae bacterium]MDE6252282.1 isoprenylcysteine carboxylmethyltransferase family protein [Lachnospiraceae bacterium]
MSELAFRIAAIAILIIFYLVYFLKMVSQRKKGITTNQIAKGDKPKKVMIIETAMKAATYLVVAAEAISIFSGWSLLPVNLRVMGIFIGIVGDIIFALAVFTMRDSWRAGIPEDDKTSLVTEGIFKYSRNPAFTGFDIVYIGILLIYFNIFLLALSIWAIVMLHLQILQEEQYLMKSFGQEYSSYKEKVMRYLGRK